MGLSEFEEQALTAVQEAIAWHTVAIDVSLGSKHNPEWGTGSLVTIGGRFFVISCKHVVRPEIKNEDLRFLYRSDKSFKWVGKESIKNIDLHLLYKNIHLTFPKSIPIISRIYSDEADDLVLLEVDPSSPESRIYQFHAIQNLGVLTPEVGHPVYYMGFSRELTRKATVYGDIGAFPFFGASCISHKEISSITFNPERHFLIDFESSQNDLYNIDPHGLSGCGVWSRVPSGEGNLWTPNIYLVGVQSGYFSQTEVLKATRIEKLLQLL